MKKFLSLFVVLVMVVCMVPMASAEETGEVMYFGRAGTEPIEGENYADHKHDTLAEVLSWANNSTYAYVHIIKAGMNNATYAVHATRNGQTFFFACESEDDYNHVKQLWSQAPYALNNGGNGGNGGNNGNYGPIDKVDRSKNVTVVVHTTAAKGNKGETYRTHMSGDSANGVLTEARQYVIDNNLRSAVYYIYLCSMNAGNITLKAGDSVYLYMIGDGWTYNGTVSFENNTDGVRMSICTGRYGSNFADLIIKYSGRCYTPQDNVYVVGTTYHENVLIGGRINFDTQTQHNYTIFKCQKENCGAETHYILHPENITDIVTAPDVNAGSKGIALEACRIPGCSYQGEWSFEPLYLSARTNKGSANSLFIGMSMGFSPAVAMDLEKEQEGGIKWDIESRNNDERNYSVADIDVYDLVANFSCKGDLTVPAGKTVWLRTDIYGRTYGDTDTHKAAVFDGKFKFETGNGNDKGTLIVREGLYTKNPSAYVDKASGYRVVPVKGADFGLSEYKNLFLVYQGELVNNKVSINGNEDAMVNSGRKTLNDFEVVTGKTLTVSGGADNSWGITPTVNAAHAVDTGKTAQHNMDTSGNAITIRVPVTGDLAVDGLAVAVKHSKNGNEVETIYGTVVKDGEAYYAEFVTENGFSTFALSAHAHAFTNNSCVCGAKQQTIGSTTVIFEETTVVPTVGEDITDETEKLIAETLAQQGVAIDVPVTVLDESFVSEGINELVNGQAGTIRIEPLVTATVKKITREEGSELDTQSVTFDVTVKLEVFVGDTKVGEVDLSDSATSMNVTLPVLLWDEGVTAYVTHIKNGVTKSTQTATVSENDTVTITNEEGYSDFVVSLKAPSTNKPAPPSYEPDKIQSPKTSDFGIALYAGMALTSAFGAMYVARKKK